MTEMRRWVLAGLWTALFVGVLAACSVDRAENKAYKPCTAHSECESNQCHKGHCVGLGMMMPQEDAAMPQEDAAPGMDAAMDAGDGGAAGDAGEADGAMPCSEEGNEIYCYSGPEGTDTVGECRPGTRACENGFFGPCTGEVVPQAEECNDDDDDCDGETDEDVAGATCQTGLAGVCGEGMLVCDQGRSMCQQVGTIGTEICDGKDNDCNGEADEGAIASAFCYPELTIGCSRNEDGTYDCKGICRAGVALCENSMMRDCEGVVTPADEDLCGPQPGRDTAEDEDCDGTIDEDCQCDDDLDTQPCYTGQEGTLGKGECKAGVQECRDNQWGNCLTETTPAAETCANLGQDNDCNGDDFDPSGKVCVDPEQEGHCAFGVEQCIEDELVCVQNEARDEQCDSTDDDCDGNVDESFDLQTDEQNCGQCGNTCEAPTATCCNGICVDTRTDENHCGACGNPCGANRECCSPGQCKALLCLL